ncbi:hypothetical protein, partial [Niallia sp.]|uniref:hypothetical protein n=1 Tax=Niallia sp. TaxID=2837523 RepID=UPI002897CB0E
MKWLRKNIINDFLEALSSNEKKDKSATINIQIFSKEVSVKFHVDNLVGIINGAKNKNNKVLALPSPQEETTTQEKNVAPSPTISEKNKEVMANTSNNDVALKQAALKQEQAKQAALKQEQAKQAA